MIESIKKVFFLPPPQTNVFVEIFLSKLFTNSIPFAIKCAVNFVIVAHPSSKDKPFAKEISKFLMSNDLSYFWISKLSNAWLSIKSLTFPDFAIHWIYH